jgi:catalase
MHNFQQDGHMAMRNPNGRANYEPNSWGDDGGPRENPEIGFESYAEEVQGTKQRTRSETFADHYSQARQFWISQTETEQRHIAAGYTFELSKCQHERIRLRMLSHLMNVHDDLADAVATGLGVTQMPEAAAPARAPITDLPASDALSILKNGPKSFAGRKLGLYVSDGADADLITKLEKAFKGEGASVAIVAPHIAGATLSDGSVRPADEKIDGGPSVLFDAVALIFSEAEGKRLAGDKPSKDFVSDAFAHAKFIGWTDAAAPLLEAAGIRARDGGMLKLGGEKVDDFLALCRELRHWPRETE